MIETIEGRKERQLHGPFEESIGINATINNNNNSKQIKSNALLKVPYLTLLLSILIISSPASGQAASDETTLSSQASARHLTTNSPPPLSSNNSTTEAAEHLLISNPAAASYVDFHTDNPILLFDNIANDQTSNASISNNLNTPPAAEAATEQSTPTSQPSPATVTAISISENKTTPEIINEPPGEEEDSSEPDGESESDLDEPGKTLEPFVPPQNVSQYMDYIERLFHDLRHQINYLFEPHIPQLIRTSQMVELSPPCSHDILRMALALRQLEPWALKMIDSSGKLPEGIFEGSFTSLGSYDQCLNILFTSPSGASSNSQRDTQQENKQTPANVNATPTTTSLVTQGKYCLVNVSPFLPPKPSPFERVDKLFQEEANRRNYSKDDQLSRLSPMFYYMRFRIGICVPSTCDLTDMLSISQALSTSLKLNITIDTCRFKQANVPISTNQLVAGSIAATVIALVLIATIMDYWHNLGEKLLRKQRNCCESLAVMRWHQHQQPTLQQDVNSNSADDSPGNQQTNHYNTNGNIDSGKDVARPISRVLRIPGSNRGKSFQVITDFGDGRNHERTCTDVVDSNNELSKTCGCTDSNQNDADNKNGSDIKRMKPDDNWTWRSFSLITNFKLYFNNKHLQGQPGSIKSNNPILLATNDNTNNPGQHQAINCLNGIRVISLCWVIVANSYITLDPRATKGLTKTREAPRDFLFQMIVQASLAIETFFFLSGLLMSLSFTKHRLAQTDGVGNQTSGRNNLLKWLRFYLHRYVRLTVPAMLVIAFTMFAFRYGDGPLWYEVTHRAHTSCAQNWWRHVLHVANYIDTRQMCFIHYWYIAADMQLFIIAPILLLILNKFKRLGIVLISTIGASSIAWIFHTTFERNLPPTLLFYSSDPESRREFGNTIMTKPYTHLLPYLVGMLLGHWFLSNRKADCNDRSQYQNNDANRDDRITQSRPDQASINLSPVDCSFFENWSATIIKLLGFVAGLTVTAEIFIPYLWNNSQLPSPLLASLYACLFRFGWALSLAYLVLSCGHKRTSKCSGIKSHANLVWCWCGSSGSLMNQFLSWNIFSHLSRLSFIAYLIHLPLMSVFVAQTRAIFAFSHMLVIHLALSYLLMTFILSFILIHIIEFPFITLERYLFQRFMFSCSKRRNNKSDYESKAHQNYITSLENVIRQQQEERQIAKHRHFGNGNGRNQEERVVSANE